MDCYLENDQQDCFNEDSSLNTSCPDYSVDLEESHTSYDDLITDQDIELLEYFEEQEEMKLDVTTVIAFSLHFDYFL